MIKQALLGLSMLLVLVISAILVRGVPLAHAQGAAAPPAFNGGGAAAYADRWALSNNWQNYPRYYDDCTNFTSQALHDATGGGYPFRTTGSNQWWISRDWWQWYATRSWSLVIDNWTFLQRDWPGGWDWGYQNTSWNTNNALRGDILYYDWDGNGTLDHTGMEVAYSGCDPGSGYCGDLQDQHSNNRYHAIWHLRPYNRYAATTRVRLMHIDYRN